MALVWEYSKRIGFAECEIDEKSYVINLYEGNALLLALYEYESEDGTIGEHLCWFFSDEAHAKNCLGLSENYHSIFESGYFKSLHFDKPQNSHSLIKIITLFLKAFPNLEIVIN